ncbi:MAG: hypothetical protein GC178_17030 [Flavobacteriales bacterium]|nr:hypothetical protein [Flavobacteriales bacterium]
MLIFLDIDGVMVPANSWRQPELMEDGFPVFSSKATAALSKILDRYNASLILTTSHKYRFSLEEWHNIFQRRGLTVNNIDRLPENKDGLSRKEELINWFQRNKTDDDFIIIDDDRMLNALPGFLKQRLLLTNSSVGLTERCLGDIGGLLAA